jgi:hypothetical protein
MRDFKLPQKMEPSSRSKVTEFGVTFFNDLSEFCRFQPHLLANKIFPTFDATSAICLAEIMRRRQAAGHAAGAYEFEPIKTMYSNFLEVRFAEWTASGRNEKMFRCVKRTMHG